MDLKQFFFLILFSMITQIETFCFSSTKTQMVHRYQSATEHHQFWANLLNEVHVIEFQSARCLLFLKEKKIIRMKIRKWKILQMRRTDQVTHTNCLNETLQLVLNWPTCSECVCVYDTFKRSIYSKLQIFIHWI